jgi:predicted AAA+ superfamily ATPase
MDERAATLSSFARVVYPLRLAHCDHSLKTLATCAIRWRARHHLDAEHLRGLRLLTPRDHNRQLSRGYLAGTLRRQRGIRLGSSIIPEAREAEHFLVTGSPGAGKSTLMRHMLTQITDRG